MKKIPGFMLKMLMVFLAVLSGCGTKGTDGEAETAAGKKTLRAVTDAAYAPFEYMDKGKIVGFDIDIVKAAAKEAGYSVKVDHVGWDPIFVEIEKKRADIAISSITINDDRKKSYDFSVPYFLSTNKILVPEGSSIKGADDLKGKVVAVQNGTTGQAAMDALLGKNNSNIKKFENNNLAIMELIKGGAAAVVADNAVIEEYAKNNPDKKLKVISDDTFDFEFYGIMFPKGSEIKADFDQALKKLMENGEYSRIYKERFGTEPDIAKLKAEAK
ncbi:transporter substrate-binding domain-containing protein [Bacillus massilinigeriensis]|uniref:transporter substrate-binding domain-containing protein n=1 Tax=Bacillus mediterraneensis TaxID=1805474 RepID=UPI0008F8745C|nr:transporter substrate-binding domain-containing protein [Bacillus mediterraneensis]